MQAQHHAVSPFTVQSPAGGGKETVNESETAVGLGLLPHQGQES